MATTDGVVRALVIDDVDPTGAIASSYTPGAGNVWRRGVTGALARQRNLDTPPR